MGRLKRDYYNYDQLEKKQRSKIVDLNEQLQKEKDKLESIKSKKRNLGLQYFSKKKRQEIYERAKEHGFSAEDLQRMSDFLDDVLWNQDMVDITSNSILALFQDAELFLDENDHTPIVKRILKWFGEIVSEDDRNDN